MVATESRELLFLCWGASSGGFGTVGECLGLHLTFPGEKDSLKFAQSILTAEKHVIVVFKSILFVATRSQTHSLDSTAWHVSKIFSGTMDNKATPCRFLSWHSFCFELDSLFGRLRPPKAPYL